jgi:hypothetical protein
MHPYTGLFACVGWFFIIGWVVSMVRAMVAADVETWLGSLAIAVAIGLGTLMINPPSPALVPLLFIATVGTVILMPILRLFANRYALRRIDVDRMADAYRALRLQPNHPSAILQIADLLWQYGFAGPAVAISDQLLMSLPKQLYFEERRKVESWKKMRPLPGMFDPVTCPRCGGKNPCHELFCVHCRSELGLMLIGGRFWNVSFVGRAIVVWLAAIAAVVGIPWCVATFPPNVSILMVLGQLLAVAFTIAIVFRSRSLTS